VAAAHAARVGGDDWTGLVAVGEHRELVGEPVAAFDQGQPSRLRWSLIRRAELDDVSLDGGPVPFVLGGWVTTTGARPPQLVVALNGRLAGTVHEYKRTGDGTWRFDAVLDDHFVEGANRVDAFEVEQAPGGPVLHRLGGGGLR
jgi:hypothetical protein